MTRMGLPHSEITGSTPACGSPMLIAACYVLHRLSLPRHPPSTLSNLTIKCLELIRICAFSTSNTYRILFTFPIIQLSKKRLRPVSGSTLTAPQGRPSPPILPGVLLRRGVLTTVPLSPLFPAQPAFEEEGLVELNGIEPMTS